MASLKRNSKVTARKSPRDPALMRLTRRVGHLTLAYVAAGRATPKKAVRKLKDDIDVWSRRTGRRDLRAISMMQQQAGNGPWTCKNCDWIMFSLGRSCFLVECNPEWKMCGYICFTLPKDPGPVS